MATFKPLYGSWTALTFGVENLASSANLDAGRESTAVDNTSTLFEDFLVGGHVTVGTTPTVDTTIEIWAYTNAEGTTSYPDVLDGTDSAETFTSVAIKRASMALMAVLAVDETVTDQVYYMRTTSLVQVLGFVPEKWGLFLTHNTGVNTNTTAGNHVWQYVGVNGQSV